MPHSRWYTSFRCLTGLLSLSSDPPNHHPELINHQESGSIRDAISAVERALDAATARIADRYVRLPVHGGSPVPRERLYCYELYHQLRRALGDDFGFSVGGEVDKRGHTIMRGLGLTNVKPDLLIHVPGDMAGNLIVIEVKSVSVRDKRPIRKDLETLTAFRCAGYRRAWYLFFGGSEKDAAKARDRCQLAAAEHGKVEVRLDQIGLLWHRGQGTSVVRLPWMLPRAGNR